MPFAYSWYMFRDWHIAKLHVLKIEQRTHYV